MFYALLVLKLIAKRIDVMATGRDGRKFYTTAELEEGTYDIRGSRNAEYTERIRKSGKYIRQNIERELKFIDFFRKRFIGCNWQKVYPLSEKDLCECVECFLSSDGARA